MPLKEQRRDDALAGEEDTIGQEHAEIRIAGARDSAGVLYPDLIGETPGYHEEVGIDDRRAVVCDLIDVLPRLPVSLTTTSGSDPWRSCEPMRKPSGSATRSIPSRTTICVR